MLELFDVRGLEFIIALKVLLSNGVFYWWAASLRYCMNEKELPTHATKMDFATSRIY